MAADFQKAECEAKRLIKKYDIKSPPIDPEWIAKQEGVNVLYARFPVSLRNDISGYYDPNEETPMGKGAIIINDHLKANRMIFTIAHELGHVVLHNFKNETDITNIQLRTNTWAQGNKPPEEQEADCFAANLLMPERILKKYKDMVFETNILMRIEALAKLFCVSTESMNYRLKSLRLL